VQRAQGWGAWPVCSARAGATGSAPAAPGGTANGSGRSSGSSGGNGGNGASNSAPHRAAPESAPSRRTAPAGRPAARHADRGASRGDYTVRTGDTLSGIAERHGTTWQRLFTANRDVIGADPDLIVPGQRLDL
jgi:nucleoid-associated protein YgaU